MRSFYSPGIYSRVPTSPLTSKAATRRSERFKATILPAAAILATSGSLMLTRDAVGTSHDILPLPIAHHLQRTNKKIGPAAKHKDVDDLTIATMAPRRVLVYSPRVLLKKATPRAITHEPDVDE